MELQMGNNSGKLVFLLAGLALGALLGMATALMIAPQSGSETRRMIRDRGQELRDRALDTVDDTRDRISHTVNDTRNQAQELAHTARDNASATAHRAVRK